MPAWDSFPVSVIYGSHDASQDGPQDRGVAPRKHEAHWKGNLRKETLSETEQAWLPSRHGKPGVVAKFNALTNPEGPAPPATPLPRDDWNTAPPCWMPVNGIQTPIARQLAAELRLDKEGNEMPDVWTPGTGRGKFQDSDGNTTGLRGRHKSTAVNLLNRDPPSTKEGRFADHKAKLNHEIEAHAEFTKLCCADKQKADDFKPDGTWRQRHTSKKAEEAPDSPATRPTSPHSAGWDTSISPKHEKISNGYPVIKKKNRKAPSANEDEASSPKSAQADEAEAEEPQAEVGEVPTQDQEENA